MLFLNFCQLMSWKSQAQLLLFLHTLPGSEFIEEWYHQLCRTKAPLRMSLFSVITLPSYVLKLEVQFLWNNSLSKRPSLWIMKMLSDENICDNVFLLFLQFNTKDVNWSSVRTIYWLVAHFHVMWISCRWLGHRGNTWVCVISWNSSMELRETLLDWTSYFPGTRRHTY